MNTQSGKPPQNFRKSGEAFGMAILLGVVFVVLAWIPGARVDPIRPYLRYLQGLAIGYAFGRLHEFLYRRQYNSDASGLKSK